MIAGTLILEDQTVTFRTVLQNDVSMVAYTVTEDIDGEVRTESFVVDTNKFFATLSIAVHHDGTPDYNKDYDVAESIQGKIRWIP